jgi:hypothetical protein
VSAAHRTIEQQGIDAALKLARELREVQIEREVPAKRGRPAGRTHTARIGLVLRPEELERYQRAADDLGVPLAAWVREACEVFASDDLRAALAPKRMCIRCGTCGGTYEHSFGDPPHACATSGSASNRARR